MFHGAAGLALKVFVAEAHIGGKRGDLTAATHQIAQRYRIDYQTLKRAVSRYRRLRTFAHGIASIAPIGAELERRTLGMPDDVRNVILNDYSGADLLELLRAHKIDMTCPQWLIDAVREQRDLMSPK